MNKRQTKAFEEITRGLIRNSADFPAENSAEEAKQIELWKKYIDWEKTNPTHVAEEAWITKVIGAYEQCLVLLGHNPDIWLDAAQFSQQSGKSLAAKGDDNAGKTCSAKTVYFFERATEKFKDNVLLHFAHAEFEEERGKFDKVHEVFKKLIAIQSDPTLTFVQYMKFARRAESVKSGRAVFKMAREDARTTYHVYVAAALTEFYRNKDKTVAVNIFEFGLKTYADNSSYILAYIDFLSHLNEDGNLRALFERVLASGSLSPDQSLVIWDRFVQFESNIGNITSILDVERRRSVQKGLQTVTLAERCKFMDLYPSAEGKQAVGELPKPETLQDSFGASVFSIPPATARLLAKLPPPRCYRGPFVNLGMSLDVLKQWQPQVLSAKLEENSAVKGQFERLGKLRAQKRSASEDENLSENLYASRMKKRWKAEELAKVSD